MPDDFPGMSPRQIARMDQQLAEATQAVQVVVDMFKLERKKNGLASAIELCMHAAEVTVKAGGVKGVASNYAGAIYTLATAQQEQEEKVSATPFRSYDGPGPVDMDALHEEMTEVLYKLMEKYPHDVELLQRYFLPKGQTDGKCRRGNPDHTRGCFCDDPRAPGK